MKSNQIIITAAFIFYTACLSSQPLLKWGQKMSGPAFDFVHAIACDSKGNIYSTGTFQDNLMTPSGFIAAKGAGDIFISKMDASGKSIWAYGFGGPQMDHARAITIDNNDEIVTAGSFEGEADMDPTFSEAKSGSAGQQNLYISKLSQSGNLVWNRSISSQENITCNNIATDKNGNIYLTGSFKEAVDFDPGTSVHLVSATKDKRDMYVLQLNAEGDFQWVKHFAVTSDDSGKSFAADADGNLYVSGSFYNLDPVHFGSVIQTPSSMEDLFVMKLSAYGECNWVNVLRGSFYNGRSSMVLDGKGQNLFFTGNFYGVADLGWGNKLTSSAASVDVFVARFAESGTLEWASQLGGEGHEEAGNICVQQNGDLLISGIYKGTLDSDPGPGFYELDKCESFDVFLCSLTSAGHFICAGKIGGTDTDRPGSLLVDNNGEVLVSGFFAQNIDVDPGATSYLITDEQQSVFVAKLNTCTTLTDVGELNALSEFKIYPNPASQNIYIESDYEAELMIYNAIGHTIKSQKISQGRNELNVSTLPRGVYIVAVRNNFGKIVFEKIILN